MDRRQTQPEEATAALGRSQVYGFLSQAFLPGPLAAVGGPSLAEAAEGVPQVLAVVGGGKADRLRAAAEELAARLREVQPAALEEEYHQVFGHQIAQDCPVYETQYLGSQVFQQAQQLADIAGFYLAFGLEVAEGAGERADHLSLELEFMQVLAFREAYARTHDGAAEVGVVRDAQVAFLRDHLARWVPVFARLVRGKTSGIYRHLADFAAAWVTAEAAALGLSHLPEAVHVPVAPEAGAADLSCGAEGCPVVPRP